MDRFDLIEEFDESILPNVSIDQEEINEIIYKVMSIIKGLKKNNKKIKFNISLNEALEIRNQLGDKVDKAIYGRKHALLMREIMIKVLEEEDKVRNEEIKDELLVYVPASYWWRGGTVCYKMYLTKNNRLIIYAFDADYKVINKYDIETKDIKWAGEAGKKNKHMYENEQIIWFDEIRIHLNPDYGEKGDDICKFIDSLRATGVPDVDKSGVSLVDNIYKIICAIVAIGIIFAIIKIII